MDQLPEATKNSNRGQNLTREDRERGGRASAAKQVRDSEGRFAGRKDKTATVAVQETKQP